MRNIKDNIVIMTLLLLLTGFSFVACDDDDKEIVVPDNWVTVSTESMSIGYEGGRLTHDFTLAKGLDASAVYIINQENWCSGYIEDGKITVDVDLSENVNGRTAKMFLTYDENHQVELTVEQGKAPVVLIQGIDKSAMPEAININETLDLNTVIKVLPANASYKNLNFTLAEGSEAFVELSATGVVKGLSIGEATINITTNDASGITDMVMLKVSGDIRLDRTAWKVSTSVSHVLDNVTMPDNTKIETGKPEDILDGNTYTFLSLVKPGKTYSGVTTPAGHQLHFIVDMGSKQSFNYFTWRHRAGNANSFLRVWGISMYGSQNGTDYEEIKKNIDIPYEDNSSEIKIDIPESSYRYVKVEIVKWSDNSGGAKSGSTVQTAEFGLGRLL